MRNSVFIFHKPDTFISSCALFCDGDDDSPASDDIEIQCKGKNKKRKNENKIGQKIHQNHLPPSFSTSSNSILLNFFFIKLPGMRNIKGLEVVGIQNKH